MLQILSHLFINQYLHSTMVLFKLLPPAIPSNRRYGFTFHYGSIQIFKAVGTFFKETLFTFHYGSIQITMMVKLSKKNVSFTFHYGSIQMKTKKMIGVDESGFTFHYGSIQIRMYQNLSSCNRIYIPLWFYSNVIDFSIIICFENLHSTMVLFK